MPTSDGITAPDWDVVHDLALQIVNAEDAQRAGWGRRLLQVPKVLLAGKQRTYRAHRS